MYYNFTMLQYNNLKRNNVKMLQGYNITILQFYIATTIADCREIFSQI